MRVTARYDRSNFFQFEQSIEPQLMTAVPEDDPAGA